jgi:hypothetical protein
MTISKQVRLIVLACSLMAGQVAFGQTLGSIGGDARDSTVDSSAIILTPQPFSMKFDRRTPYSNQYLVNLQRELEGNLVFEGFSTAAFTLQALYTFGDAGRNTIIGPAGLYLDFSTHQSFRMAKESHVLQFRWETFNSGRQRGEKCA